jgi:hypothetical protein
MFNFAHNWLGAHNIIYNRVAMTLPRGARAHWSFNRVALCRHGSRFCRAFQTGSLDLDRKAESFKQANATVIDIDCSLNESDPSACRNAVDHRCLT